MQQLAKRLVSPDSGLVCPDHWNGPDWVLTDGPAVAELNAAANFAPDPQQALALDIIFAVGANGLPASFAFCVICCRQNLKTGLFKQAAVGWLYVTDERLVVWSAHEMSTTLDAQKELGELMLGAPALKKRMLAQKNDGIYSDNGSERIELATGQVIKFKARTKSGGRGLTGDKVILDEAFALKASHVGSLLPTMGARPSGQVLYGSSAGMSDSDVLFDVRDRGRAGSSPRLSYLEWLAERRPCADPQCEHPKDATLRGIECALDDESLYRKANPTISTGRMSIQTIADLRQELPPAEFARECLGWWDEPDGADGIFGPAWLRLSTYDVKAERFAAPLLAVATTPEQSHTCISAAEKVGDRYRAKPVAHGRGIGWAVDDLAKLQADHPSPTVVIDGKGPASGLIQPLQEAGVAILVIGLDDVIKACARTQQLVDDQLLDRPDDSPSLAVAVGGAAWRWAGDRRLFGRKSGHDITPLESMALALWGLDNVTSNAESWGFWS